jgi:hypothetical protein
LFLVWMRIEFFKILTAILYGKITRSRISRKKALNRRGSYLIMISMRIL